VDVFPRCDNPVYGEGVSLDGCDDVLGLLGPIARAGHHVSHIDYLGDSVGIMGKRGGASARGDGNLREF